MTRYCLALDLKDDPDLIAVYEQHHRSVWPEVLAGLKSAGIHRMEIYRFSNRLFMIMETGPDFSFEKKSQQDLANPRIQDWETLMWTYQQSLPAAPGQKWQLMSRIFYFDSNAKEHGQPVV